VFEIQSICITLLCGSNPFTPNLCPNLLCWKVNHLIFTLTVYISNADNSNLFSSEKIQVVNLDSHAVQQMILSDH